MIPRGRQARSSHAHLRERHSFRLGAACLSLGDAAAPEVDNASPRGERFGRMGVRIAGTVADLTAIGPNRPEALSA
jgi:hypothetical protein